MNFSHRQLTISLFLRFTTALVLIALLPAGTPGQVDRAMLEGTVSDPEVSSLAPVRRSSRFRQISGVCSKVELRNYPC
jgi:hypothetical protein